MEVYFDNSATTRCYDSRLKMMLLWGNIANRLLERLLGLDRTAV